MSIRRKEIFNHTIELTMDKILVMDKDSSLLHKERIPAILTERAIVYFEEFVEKFKYRQEKYVKYKNKSSNKKENISSLLSIESNVKYKITYLKHNKEYSLIISNYLQAKKLLYNLAKDRKVKLLNVENILTDSLDSLST